MIVKLCGQFDQVQNHLGDAPLDESLRVSQKGITDERRPTFSVDNAIPRLHLHRMEMGEGREADWAKHSPLSPS